ncbi:MAG TPA: response regulator [Candidatus Angelobacter sp.]|jgi:DNA-binding response OmpR family regulator|nr:response regulator [Candidatus Angelobacter sp.]
MKTLTILVAEDDLLTRMTLERSVVQWGYQLVTALDGESARELLRSRKIDVCLLDWDLPKLNGIELCHWLRTHSNPVPYVVLITGSEQPSDIQAGYEAGANDYMTRPCDLRYLRRRIASVADKANRQELQMEKAEVAHGEQRTVAGLSPLDIYLSDLRLMRRKS